MNIALPDKITGLSSLEAKKRLAADGFNELATEKRRRLLNIIIDIVKEPMILLLLACIVIYGFSGDIREASVLALSICFIIFITVYQESKTEKALSALKSLASPRAFVWRDGECIKINSRELVRGDVILLKEGDRVPADSVIISNKNLSINESLLTGESVPVQKSIAAIDRELGSPQEENNPFVYSGTMIVAGQGIALVKAIGQQTEIGRIGKILTSVEAGKTPLQKNFAQLVKFILIIAIILCLTVIVLNILTKHGLLPSFLSGLTLAMAILPEEFPIVLAVFLSIGAWRLSRFHVLVRKLSAVESLGAATTLCVDKTGTLTENRMKLDQIFLVKENRQVDLTSFKNTQAEKSAFLVDDALRLIIKIASLASNRHTFDPLEGAIKEVRRDFFREDIYKKLTAVREYPLASDFLAMANIWKQDKIMLACVKGAPEVIMSLCGLDEVTITKQHEKIKALAQDGLRVLGVAYAEAPSFDDNLKKIKFNFLGLLGFRDPVRLTAAAAIKECYQAGIEVKMITGDYPETAKNIAKQIGLKNYETIVSGQDFSSLREDELKEKIKLSNVFARMLPEYKLQIVRALKQAGQVVAMTGDGVNDGPALKAADIGVAMGARGTDVARESAAIVLIDDNFASLVGGVKEGRKIFDNLQRAVVYLVAVHLPIAILSLLPVILGWPIIFFPVHIMFLELLVDPVCSVVFEAEPATRGLMARPPRNSKKSILNRPNLIISLVQGFSIFVFVFIIYYWGLSTGLDEGFVRATAFVTLVSSNIFLILVNRSWTENIFESLFKKNQFLWWVIALAIIFLLLSVYNPFLRSVFSFSALEVRDWIWPLIASICPALIFEVFKTTKRWRTN